jgi:hypothetical protein
MVRPISCRSGVGEQTQARFRHGTSSGRSGTKPPDHAPTRTTSQSHPITKQHIITYLGRQLPTLHPREGRALPATTTQDHTRPGLDRATGWKLRSGDRLGGPVSTSRSRCDFVTLGTVATAALAVGAATTGTASASECPNREEVRIPTAAGTFGAVAAGPRHGRKVLLHGFPRFGIEWGHQLRALGAAGYRAVAPDQRGNSPGRRPVGSRTTGWTTPSTTSGRSPTP